MKSINKKQLLLSTLLSGAMLAGAAAPSFAQTDDSDEIIVTGTRLNVNPNLTAANPVLAVTDEEIAIRGTVNIEDLTNNLPQVFAGQASEVSNGSSGTATLNLRGLGASRTLTLIDGLRLPYGSSGISAPNLDLVPTNLVERVEVLTGGASAVYGSDAIGGVANFILKDDFEGFEIDAQYGAHQNSNGMSEFDDVFAAFGGTPTGGEVDGDELNISVTMGMNSADGKGNIVMFAAYQDRAAITQDNRSFSQCALQSNADGYGCFGSANFRLFFGPGGGGFQEEDGTVVPWAGTSDQRYNYGPLNYFQRPAERWQMYTKGHYDIADNHTVFASASYTDNISDAQIAETASFGFGAYQINCDNPLIQGNNGIALTDIFGCTAADIAAGNDVSGITASHRNLEGGPRNSRLENSAFRINGGLRGTVLDDKWSYEISGQFAETSDQSTSTNDFVIANLQQAFFAVDDGNGNVVCRDQSAGCVPYNIFQRGPNGESLVTQEALDFIHGVGIVNGNTKMVAFGANAQTDLGNYGISSPYAEEGVGLLIGAEWRKDSLDARPDEISQVAGGGFTGVGGATLPVKGQVKATELFGEVQIPLVTGAAFAEELVLNGQYRYSDYSTDGNGVSNSFSTDAYGIQGTWAPVDALKFRAQYQRAVRAPNVIELFTGQDSGLPNLNLGSNGFYDPCAGAMPSATAVQCGYTGVTAAQYGSIIDVISGQTQSITGGNPDLTPETSDTITIGAVYTGTDFLDGLTASIDYFDIKVEDFITAGIGVQTTLDQCIATGDAAFCDLITRGASGDLNAGVPGVGFLATNLNIAELQTSGIDLQAGYNMDLNGGSWGDLTFNYAATILTKFDDTAFPGDAPVECAGKFGNDCLQPVNPKYRHRFLTTWNTPWDGVQLNATWRHFAGVDNISAAPAPLDEALDAVNYIDLSGNWTIRENVTLRAGMNNIFLDQPPVSVSSGPPLGNGNTYPTIYDTGRFMFVGLKWKM